MMEFKPGHLYRITRDYDLFVSYGPNNVLYVIKRDSILTFLDWFEYKGDRIVVVKRFLVDDRIVMDDTYTLKSPQDFFEEVKADYEI